MSALVIVIFIFIALCAFLAVLAVNARIARKQLASSPSMGSVPSSAPPGASAGGGAGPAAESVERFRAALRIPTVWSEEADRPGPAGTEAAAKAEAVLSEFQDFLVDSYPAFHAAAEREVLSPYGLMYRWPGIDSSLEPVLLLAHYDVVPAEADSWSVDPFAATLKDGFIWARGALDTKNTLISAMEAAEALASKGFRPPRDVYFAFGGDEERSGVLGAQRTVKVLEQRGLRFAWCLDEGSIVSVGMLAGVQKPLAIVGVEEKGFLDVELSVPQEPGHASRPPKVQAVAVLGRALHRLSKRPFPWSLTPTVELFFRGLAPYVPFGQALVLANARRLGRLFFLALGGSPATSALMRTTVAMTQLEGSPADNVMPSEARAILNLRLLPPWTVDRAVNYVREVINDKRVVVRASPARPGNDPVPAGPGAADGSSAGWPAINAALGATFPDAAILPFLVTATTDSRYYAKLCDSVYRFGPVSLTESELSRIHGIDERISLENLAAGIAFYERLLESL